MNIEEIKLITDTITTLGVQGKEAFIWWLLLNKVLPFTGWVFAACLGYKTINHIVTAATCEQHVRRFFKKATGCNAPYFIEEEHILQIEEKLNK